MISQHLAILKENGIVSAEVQKTKRVYSIIDPFIAELVKRSRTKASSPQWRGPITTEWDCPDRLLQYRMPNSWYLLEPWILRY